jgi:hypothetical protein
LIDHAHSGRRREDKVKEEFVLFCGCVEGAKNSFLPAKNPARIDSLDSQKKEERERRIGIKPGL